MRGISTVLRDGGRHYLLNGAKFNIALALIADFFLVVKDGLPKHWKCSPTERPWRTLQIAWDMRRPVISSRCSAAILATRRGGTSTTRVGRTEALSRIARRSCSSEEADGRRSPDERSDPPDYAEPTWLNRSARGCIAPYRDSVEGVF